MEIETESPVLALSGRATQGLHKNGGDSIDVNALAYRVGQGDTDSILPLWNSVYAFIRQRAALTIRYIPDERGVTVDDLIQCGFFALLSAAKSYDPSRGGYLNWLEKHLKQEFAIAGGYRSTKRDPLDYSTSLNLPVPGTEDEASTFLDILPDSRDQYGDSEERIYYEQLHDTLVRAMSDLPEAQSAVIRRRYWDSESLRTIADALGISIEGVRTREKTALSTLRRNSTRNGLADFIADKVDYYRGVSARNFIAYGVSSVERNVMLRERLRDYWLKTHRAGDE